MDVEQGTNVIYFEKWLTIVNTSYAYKNIENEKSNPWSPTKNGLEMGSKGYNNRKGFYVTTLVY